MNNNIFEFKILDAKLIEFEEFLQGKDRRKQSYPSPTRKIRGSEEFSQTTIYIQEIIKKYNEKLKKIEISPEFEEKVNYLRSLIHGYKDSYTTSLLEDLEEAHYEEINNPALKRELEAYDYSKSAGDSTLEDEFISNQSAKLDYLENEHYRILALKSEKFILINNIFKIISNHPPVSSQAYIIFLYYIFFDEWIEYDKLVEIMKKGNPSLVYPYKRIRNTLYPKSSKLKASNNKLRRINGRDISNAYLTRKAQIAAHDELTEQIESFISVLNEKTGRDFLKIVRDLLDVDYDDSVEGIGENYKRNYHYLLKYREYSVFYDDFLLGMLDLLESFDELHYKNELDYLLILNYVVNETELNNENLKEILSKIIVESFPGDYFDNDILFDRESLYCKIGAYCTTDYLDIMEGKINSDAVFFYGIPAGKERMNNEKDPYVKKRIKRIYDEIYESMKKVKKDSKIKAREATYDEFEAKFPGILALGDKTKEEKIAKILGTY